MAVLTAPILVVAADHSGPIKVSHNWSLSGIAKILDENKEAFGDRITGIRFSSHLSFKSKDHDYIFLPPSGKLRAKHALFATPSKMKGKFILSGYFLETENVPDAWRANNIPAEWTLSDNPVGNVFEFAATVVSATMYIDRENLGKDFSQLCRGELVSKPVKMRVFEK